MEQTLKRTNKYWKELKKASKKKGQVPVDGQLMEEFIEACMQTRALTDDFLMLAECKAPARPKAGEVRKNQQASRQNPNPKRKRQEDPVKKRRGKK